MTAESDFEWYVERVLADEDPGDTPLIFGSAARWNAYWWRQLHVAATSDEGAGRDEVVVRASRQGFVLRTGQLDGLASRSRMRTAVRRGRWYVPARGVVSPLCLESPAPDGAAVSAYDVSRRKHALDSAAAVLIRPGFVISGRSATVVRGLPTMAVPDRPELTALNDVRLGARDCANVRGATLSAADVDSWFGAPVTTVSRTLVDLARHDRRDAIMAADAALHERLVSERAVAASLAQATGWPGVRQARDILALASPLAESPLESLTRLALLDSGFPVPELQVAIRDAARGRTYRADIVWPRARLVLEVDGRGKYTGDELWREKQREQRLVSLGYRVVRVTWDDVVRHWPETSARLRAALRSC